MSSSESTIEKAHKNGLSDNDAALLEAATDDAEEGTSEEATRRVDLEQRDHALAPSSDEKFALDRPSSVAMTLTIASRELRAYFNSAITYIVIAASMISLGVYFFFYNKGGFWQVDRVTMQRMFDSLPLALCVLVIPLFTMRTLSDEKRIGTIELLITMPVKDSEVILGKYLAALAIVSVQLFLVVLYPLAMFKWPWHLGELDWGAFWVGMFGLFCLSAFGTAVGLMYSSFTESQILSFFATMLTLSLLYLVGQLTTVESLQGWAGDAIAFFSLQTRFDSFARGLLDTRSVVYFLSLAAFCLVVAFHALERRKWT